MMRRRGLIALLLAVAAVAAEGTTDAAGQSPDATGYCVPGNTRFDPSDVPAGGSREMTVPGVSRRTLTVDGLSSQLLEAGPQSSSEAVVFLHGNPGSAQDWLDLLPRVGALGLRAVAFDLPGFGHASKPWDFPYNLEGYTRWLTDALRRLGIDRVHFVLHDVGGPLGLEWGKRQSQALISVVVIDTGALLGYQDHFLARIWRTPQLGELFQESIDRQSFEVGVQNGNQQRPLPQAFVDRMYDDYDRPTRCAVLALYRSANDVNGFAEAQARVLRQQRGRPALVVWGQNDPYLPWEMALRQREAFPSASVHVFADSGHWPFIDDPARTAGLVVPFLRCVPTGQRDRIRLAVSPRRLRAGRPARLSVAATILGRARPVCGASVRAGGLSATTDGFGRAVVTVDAPARRRRLPVRASKPGLAPGRAVVWIRIR